MRVRCDLGVALGLACALCVGAAIAFPSLQEERVWARERNAMGALAEWVDAQPEAGGLPRGPLPEIAGYRLILHTNERGGWWIRAQPEGPQERAFAYDGYQSFYAAAPGERELGRPGEDPRWFGT